MNGDGQTISSYLLGELDSAEAEAFERRLAEDAALRDEVERLRPVVGRLEALPADVWDPLEPPPLVLPEDAESAQPDPSRRRARWRFPTLTLRPGIAAGLAAVLLLAGAGLGILIDGGGSGELEGGAMDLVLERIGDGPPGAHGDVLVAADRQRATVDVGGLAPSGQGRFYELWLLDEDGRMIALGSFRVGEGGRAKVELPIPVAPAEYRYFDLSLQEDNGDPTHSGVSVLRGPTAS